MLASAAAIFATVASIVSTGTMLLKAGKDASTSIALLKEIFSGKSVTVDQLADIRARNDALNTEIEGQTESGN